MVAIDKTQFPLLKLALAWYFHITVFKILSTFLADHVAIWEIFFFLKKACFLCNILKTLEFDFFWGGDFIC